MRRWFLIGKVHRVVFLLVLSPGLFSNPSLTAQTTAGQAHFLKGKQLIEDNCIDCMRGTQAGMEQGIQEMNQAIEAGYPGKKAAYKFLLDAFKHMQTYTERDPKQSEMFRQKELDLIRKLYELYPRDPEILQAYAYTVKDEDKQIEVLRKILSLDTKHPGTRFELGILLIKKKNLAEGISLLREGVRDEQNPESMMNIVARFAESMDSAGCPLPGSEKWIKESQETFDKATNGAGDPTALPGFKKRFLAATENLSCINPGYQP